MYALITGGSRGIGKAIAIKLAQQGYNILLNYHSNIQAAEETATVIQELGKTCELIQFDAGDKEQTIAALEKWLEANPESMIEVLVNNAGIRKDNLMMLMSDNEWDSVLKTNLDSFFYVTRTVLSRILANKYGRIINVVSLSGIKGMQGQTNYAASKAGVIAATKSLAMELGRKNITVNAVAPGFIKTDMTQDIQENDFKMVIPMRRFGTAEEVAETVAFLASKGASYITGEVISVNGGLYT